MATNEYGLDSRYMRSNLQSIIDNIEHYRPDEIHRALIKLASIAKPENELSDHERMRREFWADCFHKEKAKGYASSSGAGITATDALIKWDQQFENKVT